MSEERALSLGLKPLAFKSYADAAQEPKNGSAHPGSS
jgi:acetyl-CoA acetyltransferase